MPINQAAKRLARAFRIAFRAARILATDSELPRLLRILFVIGLVQVPCLPTDEIAMALALGWLFLFHRDRLAHAVREARSSDPKEHKSMSIRSLFVIRRPANVRRFVLTMTAALAAMAAVGLFAVGAVPAFASTHPQHSPRSLVAAVTSGATVSIDGVTRAAVPVSYPPQASCRSLLSAYRSVSWQAGVVIGSTHVQAIPQTGPGSWARVLRRAGDYPLAAAALAVRSRATDRDFVMALTASAAAALEGSGCR